MKAAFPIQPELTAIAIAYKNRSLIADQVLPRVPVGKQDFKYLKFNLADGFTSLGNLYPPFEILDKLVCSVTYFS